MIESLARLGDDAAGIEKTLRLFQGFCTILAGLSWPSFADAQPWTQARSQLALGRRYFRLLKWYPCWKTAWRTLTKSDLPPLMKLLEMAKWSFLGMYFFLEMPTLTNTMRATNFAWGHVLVVEANKFWYYGIFASLVIGLLQLLSVTTEVSETTKEVEPTSPSNEKSSTQPPINEARANPYPKIFRQLVIDGCDLIIAGSAVGWVDADAVQVGIAYVISTTVAGQQIWNRIQTEPR